MGIRTVTDKKKKETIEKSWRNNKLIFNGFKIFNTSWAKDKYGRRDTKNLACFVEFLLNGKKVYWLPKEREPEKILSTFKEVFNYNLTHNSGAKEFLEKVEK